MLEKTGGRDDPRLTAAVMSLIRLRQDAQDSAGARALMTRYGLPGDLCSFADPRVRLVSSSISEDDYPADLLAGSVESVIVVNLDVDAQGLAVKPRIIVAGPPFAFDASTLAIVPTMRFEAPRQAGHPTTCRDLVQRVRWQINS